MMWDKIKTVESIKVLKKNDQFNISGKFNFSKNKIHSRTYTIFEEKF